MKADELQAPSWASHSSSPSPPGLHREHAAHGLALAPSASGQDMFEVVAEARRNPKRAWRRNRDEVEAMLVRGNLLAAGFGVGGLLLAVVQTELLLKDFDPKSVEVDMLKAATSSLCLASVVVIYRIHWLRLLQERLIEHLRLCHTFDDNVSLRHVVQRPKFWLEVVVALVHCPPMLTGELANESIGNVSGFSKSLAQKSRDAACEAGAHAGVGAR